MANPQIEDGFTKIANELLDALGGFKCSGAVTRFVIIIIRETYGYHTKDKKIPTSHLCGALKMSERRIRTVRNIAIKSNMITYEKGIYSIVKDYEKWVVCNTDSNDEKVAEMTGRLSSNPVQPCSVSNPVQGCSAFPVQGCSAHIGSKDKRNITTTTLSPPEKSASKNNTQNELDLGVGNNAETTPETSSKVDREKEKITNLKASFSKRELPYVENYLDVLRGENKTGKISLSREITVLQNLIDFKANEEISEDAIIYGLSAATGRNISAENYYKKASRGYNPNNPGQTNTKNAKPFSLVNNSFLGYEENWDDVETNYYGKDITGDYDE